MASRMLRVGLAAAVLTASCLWPAEYYLVPEAVNSPPVIDTFAVDPDPLPTEDGIVRWDPATTPQLEFALLKVTDNDLDDTLYVRWFVAYEDLDVVRDPVVVDDIPGGELNRGPLRFTLTATRIASIDAVRGALTPGAARRPYVVEALISDSAPIQSGNNPFGDNAYVARWRWVVVVASTGGE